MVKGSQYVELANDLEINKAITYLRQRDFKQVDGSLETHSNYVAFDIYYHRTEPYCSMSVWRFCFCLITLSTFNGPFYFVFLPVHLHDY